MIVENCWENCWDRSRKHSILARLWPRCSLSRYLHYVEAKLCWTKDRPCPSKSWILNRKDNSQWNVNYLPTALHQLYWMLFWMRNVQWQSLHAVEGIERDTCTEDTKETKKNKGKSNERNLNIKLKLEGKSYKSRKG